MFKSLERCCEFRGAIFLVGCTVKDACTWKTPVFTIARNRVVYVLISQGVPFVCRNPGDFDLELIACDISHSGWHGIGIMSAGSISIQGCNVHHNTGVGVFCRYFNTVSFDGDASDLHNNDLTTAHTHEVNIVLVEGGAIDRPPTIVQEMDAYAVHAAWPDPTGIDYPSDSGD